jgi:hypothetical protein
MPASGATTPSMLNTPSLTIRRKRAPWPPAAALEVGEVGVGVAEPGRLAQPHPVDDRGVVQGVADDRVLGAQQRLEQPGVGVEAAGVEDRVLGADERRDAPLELAVLVLGAADEAHRGDPEPVLVDAALGGRHHLGVVGQAQVVVGAQVEHAAAVGEGDLGLLLTDDLALALAEPLGLDRQGSRPVTSRAARTPCTRSRVVGCTGTVSPNSPCTTPRGASARRRRCVRCTRG